MGQKAKGSCGADRRGGRWFSCCRLASSSWRHAASCVFDTHTRTQCLGWGDFCCLLPVLGSCGIPKKLGSFTVQATFVRLLVLLDSQAAFMQVN